MFLLGLILLLVIPQLVSVAVLRGGGRGSSGSLGVLAPMAAMGSYIVGSWAFWFAEAARVESARGEPACGAFGAMVVFLTLGGAIAHGMGSVLTVLIWRLIRPRRRRQSQTT